MITFLRRASTSSGPPLTLATERNSGGCQRFEARPNPDPEPGVRTAVQLCNGSAGWVPRILAGGNERSARTHRGLDPIRTAESCGGWPPASKNGGFCGPLNHAPAIPLLRPGTMRLNAW